MAKTVAAWEKALEGGIEWEGQQIIRCMQTTLTGHDGRYQRSGGSDRSCLIGIEFLASYYPEFAKEPKVNTVGAVLAMLQDEYSSWRSKFELHPKAAESGKTELR
jgi:hypothetical protein